MMESMSGLKIFFSMFSVKVLKKFFAGRGCLTGVLELRGGATKGGRSATSLFWTRKRNARQTCRPRERSGFFRIRSCKKV